MDTMKKLGWGSFLAAFGGLGIVLGALLGLAELGRPWSFLAGFIFGLSAGVGCALAVAGLVEKRRIK